MWRSVKYGIQMQKDWQRIKPDEERCDQILCLSEVDAMNKFRSTETL